MYSKIDFYRNVFVLIPGEDRNHETFLIEPIERGSKARIFCSCSRRGYAKCKHGALLGDLYTGFIAGFAGKSAADAFSSSFYWKLFEPLARVNPVRISTVSGKYHDVEKNTLVFTDKTGNTLFSCISPGDYGYRLLERVTIATATSRAALMTSFKSFF